jgi:hypothetical protein
MLICLQSPAGLFQKMRVLLESRLWRRAIVQNGIMPKTVKFAIHFQRHAVTNQSYFEKSRERGLSRHEEMLQELPLCQSGEEKQTHKERYKE